jgi:glycine cleavage system H protein
MLYSEDHEYVRMEAGVGTIGITDYAQKALGDVVYVELPKVGAKLEKGGQAGVVESVKSASEVYSPVSGEVVEVNAALAADPALVNQDAEGKAWFFKIKLANENELQGLKDAAGYKAFTGA